MKGAFSLALRRTGVTLGPSIKQTRHSDLCSLKSWMCGERVTFGDTGFRRFGRALHLLFLLGKKGKDFRMLSTADQLKIISMNDSLNRHPVVKELMSRCPTRERRRPTRIESVRLGFTPDAHGVVVVVDLKTTICNDRMSFIEASIKYGYVRQAVTYLTALGLKEYWIIGIQKIVPYKVYLVNVTSKEFKDEFEYAKKELEFLLYIYKHYGNPNWKRINGPRANVVKAFSKAA